jgi:hypothetical protein
MSIRYPHPYEHEINNLQFSHESLQTCKERKYIPLQETRLTWIDTPDLLLQLSSKLSAEKEFAVDLEVFILS